MQQTRCARLMHGFVNGDQQQEGVVAWFTTTKEYNHYINRYKDSDEMESAAADFNGLGLLGCVSSKSLT